MAKEKKCYCHIHREMSEGISAIWGGGVIAFIWTFFIQDLPFTFEHLTWWWATIVTLRLLAIEPVRFFVIRKQRKKIADG
jgi:hypothetical protein